MDNYTESQVNKNTYVFVEAIDFSLDGAASSVQSLLNLLVGLLEGVDQDVVDGLRSLGLQETLGAEEVLDHQVKVALTTAQL